MKKLKLSCPSLWGGYHVMVAEERLDAVLSGVPEVKNEFSQGAHQRLDHMLQVAEQIVFEIRKVGH